MDMITTFLFFILFLFFYFLISSSSNRNLPPEADGARPILRHLHLMGGADGQLPHVTLGEVAEKRGPIFTMRLGSRLVVVVSSWKIAKEIFTTCDVAVSNRPKLRATKHLTSNFAMFGFAPYGPYWRHLRKLVSMKLLSSHRVDLLSKRIASEVALSIKEMHTSCVRESTSRVRYRVDLKKWFDEMNMNMILGVVAGKRFGRSDVAEMRWCVGVVKDFFELAGMFVPRTRCRFWGGWIWEDTRRG